jgi:hypothetical protein
MKVSGQNDFTYNIKAAIALYPKMTLRPVNIFQNKKQKTHNSTHQRKLVRMNIFAPKI